MNFKLNIKSGSEPIKFEDNSAIVKFFIEAENLERLMDDFFGNFTFSLSRLQRKYFLDKKNDKLIVHSSNPEPSAFYLKKLKVDKDFSVDVFRNYLSEIIQSLNGKGIESLNIIVPSFSFFPGHFESDEYMIQTMLEGIHLGNYSFDKYKTEKKSTLKLSIAIHYNDQKLINRVIDRTSKLMDAIVFSRDLVNEPAITLTPLEFSKRTAAEFKNSKVKVTIFNKKELSKRKMNAVLAVGGASENEPVMIILHYKPKIKSKKKIALVGKGVTYDSGGLSIKPTSGMLEMKADMAGGALVVGTIKAASELNLPVEIIGVVPAVENMIGGRSFKPGDVIKSYSGKTIEVKDTDAEGRLILADALHYASQQKPEEIIDFATLTGACVVALGDIAAGIFTNNDRIADELFLSSQKTFERIWRLPFWSEYKDMIKSEIADVSNLGPRWGGAITAGKFLEHFVDENIPWAHLDIAGPALKHKSTSYTEKYDTGFGVRLMIDYLSKI